MSSRYTRVPFWSLLLCGSLACGDPKPATPSLSNPDSSLDAPVPCVGCWVPVVGERWQYQLQGRINVDIMAAPASGGALVAPSIFDFDLYVDPAVAGQNDLENTDAVNAVHAKGGRAICYVSAGSWEDWRPDAAQYPDTVLGRKNGWPGELWVDIRRIDVLGPLLSARAEKCKQAGFDAIEWDNVDGYTNRTGFPLTAEDQLRFNIYLANLAHQLGLSVALKNDVEQLSTLKPYFDFAINEQCFQYRECDYPPPGYPDWTLSGKAVLNVEYRSRALSCAQANDWNFSSILKEVDLYDVPWVPCR